MRPERRNAPSCQFPCGHWTDLGASMKKANHTLLSENLESIYRALLLLLLLFLCTALGFALELGFLSFLEAQCMLTLRWHRCYDKKLL